MGTYSQRLPQVFPYVVVLPSGTVRRLVVKIMTRKDLSNGSSFAVTADSGRLGYSKLWLSAASYHFLKGEAGLFANQTERR